MNLLKELIDNARNQIPVLQLKYNLIPTPITEEIQPAMNINDLLDTFRQDWIEFTNAIDELDIQVDIDLNIAKVNYDADLAKIASDLADSISEAWSNYYQSLASLDADYQSSLSQSQEDHRQEELRAEEDHLKDMRRLREDYLMDLSDALRERDAIAIMRLMREYNVNKQRREEDYADQKRQRDEDYARQKQEQKKIIADVEKNFNMSYKQIKVA